LPRLLIDTDVAIDYLRGQDYARRLLKGSGMASSPGSTPTPQQGTHPATAAFDLFFQASVVLKS
jgi:hypothetical protein